MTKKIFYLFILFIQLTIFGQNSTGNIKDTIFYYNHGKKYYVLDLVGTKQTIYFDNAKYDNNQPIIILVQNNSNDTVWISHSKGLVSGKHFFHELSTRYLKPYECYSLSLKLPEGKYNPGIMMPMNDFITLYYTLNFQEKRFHFTMKGNVELGEQPKFEVEEHPNVILASSPIPESILKHQDSLRLIQRAKLSNNPEIKTPQFKFRRELWVYPKTETKGFLENLTLKYFINDSSFFAKKRLDTLNQVYFRIPSELGDSIYFVLSSSEYGFIAKKSIVRDKRNEIGIDIKPVVKLNQPHYYNLAGNRVAVNKSFIGYYYIPHDYSNNDYTQRRIDSLNTLIKKYNAFLKYGLEGGFILKCKQEQAIEIKKKLGNADIHQLIEERRWVTDYYDIFFEPKLSKAEIKEILLSHGITDFFVSYSEPGNKEWTNLIYQVSIKLDNLPWNNTNNQLINKLLEQKEILKIVQKTIHFPVTNE